MILITSFCQDQYPWIRLIKNCASCPRDHSIEIINGNYGRFTITLCNNKVAPFCKEKNTLKNQWLTVVSQGAQNWSVNCYLESAMTHMAGKCNGRRWGSILYITLQIIFQGGTPFDMF